MDSLPSVLWDYAPAAPSIIALIISVIAIWNPFSGENKWVTRCAIVAAILGIMFTVGVRNHELEVGTRERENAEHRLSILGALIAKGDAIQNALSDMSVPENTDELSGWINETEAFLSKELGAAFVARFRDYAGLTPPEVPSNMYTTSTTPARVQHWALVMLRLARLQQFSDELSARVR
jgi:hypothetical protein